MRTAENNDDVLKKFGAEVWCGDGCNMMGDLAKGDRVISERKAGRKPVGRGIRKRHREQTVSRQAKGRVEIAHPED